MKQIDFIGLHFQSRPNKKALAEMFSKKLKRCKKPEFIGFIYGSGIKDPIVESLSIRPDEFNRFLQVILKMQITFKDKARTDEKAEHTWEYVSILKRFATP